MLDFIRLPFRGRKPYEERRAKQEAISRAAFASQLLHSPAFEDSFQCELDILVSDMLELEPDTEAKVQQLLRLHARTRELNNLVAHLRAFARQKQVIEILDEKAA